MARQSLYEIVSNTVKDGKGKSSIGYSLFNSYEGTLKDLESSPSFNSRFGEVGQITCQRAEVELEQDSSLVHLGILPVCQETTPFRMGEQWSVSC